MSFPAWQMPFGGHQQICRNRIISHFPFIHLLHRSLYKLILRTANETEGCIKELLNIKRTKITIEYFERLLKEEEITILDKQLYFINPHYEIKFGLHPKKLYPFIAQIPYIRDFCTTSCFYILKN